MQREDWVVAPYPTHAEIGLDRQYHQGPEEQDEKHSKRVFGGVHMSRLISAAERITRARALIQQARDLPVPEDGGRADFSYIASVKDLLRQARDLIKFIPMSPSASDEMKADVKKIYQEADQADQEILHGRKREDDAA